MTKQERILKNIERNNELVKDINKISFFSEADFIDHAKRYISAIKQGRMICKVESVSKSGMSRTIKFMECSKGVNGYNYLNFFVFFKALGYKPTNGYNNTFRINGCGMDMIFHTNYSIMHNLCRLGFISKKECAILAQKTPSVI